MTLIELPFLTFYIGAILALVLRGPWRAAILLAIPIFGGWQLWQNGVGLLWQFEFLAASYALS